MYGFRLPPFLFSLCFARAPSAIFVGGLAWQCAEQEVRRVFRGRKAIFGQSINFVTVKDGIHFGETRRGGGGTKK